MTEKLIYDKPRRTLLTQPQIDWLSARPEYCLVGRPRAGAPTFRETGTLYADGRFDPMAPMKVVKLENGCVAVGIPSDLYLTEATTVD